MIGEFACIVLLLGYAFALPSGAPLGACKDMTPRHQENVPSSLANNPYRMSVNSLANGQISGKTGIIFVMGCCKNDISVVKMILK